MVFLVLSDYTCVESGSVLGMTCEMFTTTGAAVQFYDAHRNERIELARREMLLIRSTPGLEFNAPYVLWLLMLELPSADATSSTIDEALKALLLERDVSSDLDDSVRRAEGWVFTDLGTESYSLAQIYDDLAAFFELE